MEKKLGVPRKAHGDEVQQERDVTVGVPSSQLPQDKLRELLTTLMRSPPDIIQQVGHLVMLFAAIMQTSLPTDVSCGLSNGGRSSRALPLKNSQNAGRHAFATTAGERKQNLTLIGAAEESMKNANRKAKPKTRSGKGSMKASDVGNQATRTQMLKCWAAKSRRNVSSLIQVWHFGAAAMQPKHARLFKYHASSIPVDKISRVSDQASL